MHKIHKIETIIAATAILSVLLFMMPTPSLTGHIPGANITLYKQSLNITVDKSKSYSLSSIDEKILHLESFILDGTVIGNGRVEILLDNKKGQLFLIYENKRKKSKPIPYGITGKTLTGKTLVESIKEEKGIWLIFKPSRYIEYKFPPLEADEEIIRGHFSSACTKTCKMPPGLFNSTNYELIFRLEDGTKVTLDEIKYILQEG